MTVLPDHLESFLDKLPIICGPPQMAISFTDAVVALRGTLETASDRRSLSLLAICVLLLDLEPADRAAALQELLNCCKCRLVRRRADH